jgi:hypothetical protein
MSDTIIKVANKTENFTIVSNEVPKRNDLSARAKGLYFYLMTLPKTWEIHKCEIYEHFTEGRDALDNAFNELMKSGYITQEVKKEKGKFVSFTYTIYEESTNGKPLTGKPETVLPETENPQLLSTNSLLSTNQLSTNKEESPENPAPVSEKLYSSESYILADLLSSLHIQNIDQKCKPITPKQNQAWAKDIEMIERIDGRSYQDIEKAIRWIKTPGQFWAPNIMSGSKLREKFPTIWAQMTQMTQRKVYAKPLRDLSCGYKLPDNLETLPEVNP